MAVVYQVQGLGRKFKASGFRVRASGAFGVRPLQRLAFHFGHVLILSVSRLVDLRTKSRTIPHPTQDIVNTFHGIY